MHGINMGTRGTVSSARRERLTHVAAELGMRITAWVTPRPGADKEPAPIAHVSIDYGPDHKHGGGVAMTVTDPDLLIDAGLALIQAGQMLRQDQAAYRSNPRPDLRAYCRGCGVTKNSGEQATCYGGVNEHEWERV